MSAEARQRKIISLVWHLTSGASSVSRETTSEAKGEQMGFLDKLKGTAKQAVNPVGQAGERDKIMRINQAGVQMPATVNSMREVGTQFGGGHQIEFDLTVHPEGGTDYQVQVSQSMHDVTLQGIAAGGKIIVKVDPDDPQSLLVWGAAPA
jgi:hypothetical protein